MLRTILLAALFALALHPKAHCQEPQRQVVLDTTWLTNNGGIFFSSNLKAYADGASEARTTPIGDTSRTFGVFVELFRQRTEQFSTDVTVTAGYRSQVTELARLDAEVKRLTGKSPTDSLRRARRDLVGVAWAIGARGVETDDLFFDENGKGELRWRIGREGEGKERAEYIGDIIRLYGYSADEKFTDFYADKRLPGRYTTPDRSVRIIAPGGKDDGNEKADKSGGKRNATAPPSVTVVFNADGSASVVTITESGGTSIVTKKFKNKKWVQL